VPDEPVPNHVFEDPTVQANIAEALAKVREGRAKPGKTARELTTSSLRDEEAKRRAKK
jgi:hypothetical protein